MISGDIDNEIMKRSAVVTLLILALFACVARANEIVRVTSLEAGVYAAPAGDNLDIRLHRGSLVHYLGASKGWVHVRLRNGVEGWMAGWSVVRTLGGESLPPVPNPQVMNPSHEQPVSASVFSDTALMRSEPTNLLPAAQDHTRLGMLPRGTPLRLVGRKGHWYRATLGRAEGMWIYDELLDFSAQAPAAYEAQLQAVTVLPDKRHHTLQIALDRKAPYRFFTTERGVELRIYGAAAGLAAARMPVLADPFTVREAWPDTLIIECALPHMPVGYSAQYLDLPMLRGATLVFQVNKARPPMFAGNGNLAGWRIALDPGHGAVSPPPGYAAGTSTRDGLAEHQVNLTVALAAARYLEAQGAQVILTRTGLSDDMNDLYARTDLAQKQGADLFVSIHANGGPPAAHGLEVYYFEPQSQALAAALAQQLEANIQTGPGQTRYASFAVLRQTEMPAALVELGYMTNPQEAKLFHDPGFLDSCARGVTNGITSYIQLLSSPGHPAY
jgi:N-acetylmuramoyl-L-alanine amidase